MIADYDQFFHPIVTKIHTGPVFHKTQTFLTFWHKNGIFQTHISQEINFVWDLSLSQQHILMRSGNQCFLPCFTTDINRHLNGLIGKTKNQSLKLTSNKYHAMQNSSALIHSQDVITLPDEAEGWWFLLSPWETWLRPLGRREVYIPLQTIGPASSGGSVLILTLTLYIKTVI